MAHADGQRGTKDVSEIHCSLLVLKLHSFVKVVAVRSVFSHCCRMDFSRQENCKEYNLTIYLSAPS